MFCAVMERRSFICCVTLFSSVLACVTPTLSSLFTTGGTCAKTSSVLSFERFDCAIPYGIRELLQPKSKSEAALIIKFKN